MLHFYTPKTSKIRGFLAFSEFIETQPWAKTKFFEGFITSLETLQSVVENQMFFWLFQGYKNNIDVKWLNHFQTNVVFQYDVFSGYGNKKLAWKGLMKTGKQCSETCKLIPSMQLNVQKQ